MRAGRPASIRLISWVVAAITAFTFYWLTTRGTLRPNIELPGAGTSSRFFLAQAESLVRGRFAVDPAELPGECYLTAGECIGYYGITPSLVRIPFLPFLNAHGSLTPVFLATALSLAAWSTIDMTRNSWSEAKERDLSDATTSRMTRHTKSAVIAIAISSGLGSILIQLTRPAMYEEAIAWAAAFLCLALRSWRKWINTRNAWSLAATTAFLALGAGARPTALPAAIALGVFTLWQSLKGNRAIREPRHRRWVGISLGFAMIVLASSLSLGVYQAKFHTFVPDLRTNESVINTPSWQEIIAKNEGETTGLRFVSTSLITYLRPDALSFSGEPPFVGFRFPQQSIIWAPPLTDGSAYVERVSSIPTTMPLFLILTVVTFLWAVRNLNDRRTERSTALVLILAAGSILVVTTGNIAITNRYLGDFYPLLAIGAAFSPFYLTRIVDGRGRIPVGAGVWLLTATSVFVNFALLNAASRP